MVVSKRKSLKNRFCKNLIFKKNLLFLLLFLTPANSFAWPFSSKKENVNELDKLELLERADLPKINIPGFKSGKVAITPVGMEIYEEFLKIKDFDMSYVRQLLNRNSGSKFYHLYSAYCYGFYMWQQTSDPYEKEMIKRAVWNIAIEFSQQNSPRWQAYFYKLFPMFSWTAVLVFAIVWGLYLKNNTKFFDQYGGKIWEKVISIVNAIVTDGKNAPTGK